MIILYKLDTDDFPSTGILASYINDVIKHNTCLLLFIWIVCKVLQNVSHFVKWPPFPPRINMRCLAMERLLQ